MVSEAAADETALDDTVTKVEAATTAGEEVATDAAADGEVATTADEDATLALDAVMVTEE